MKSSIFALVSGTLLLASAVSADGELLPLPDEVQPESDAFAIASFFDWFTPWVQKTWKGSNYQCKCAPGDYCWPSQWKWQMLNLTVDGNLKVSIPPAASCYNTFQGPLGNINTYDAAKCAEVTANFADEQYQIDHPTAGLWTYFTNDTCRPTTNPSDTCTNGYYPVLYITAKTISHIQAGVSFARDNNLRLIVRNTGHDFLGRSVGWGALVINTRYFQNISTTDKWIGPGGYSGSAITVGAGVQAKAALQHLHGLNPPKIMVTGECATVGVAGGLPQGGGHGPWTNREGFLADTALQFKVITADGWLRTANSLINPDLFWALRGGGPSAFGIIVEATYKTFNDLPSAAISLDINGSHSSDANQIWEAIRIFHSYATTWVDNGLYVYYEIFGPMLHVQPFVGINKTQVELQSLVQPLFDDLNTLGIGYSTSNHTYSTFYDLYFALFEVEAAGSSALTGGWSIGKQDHQNNATAIVNAFRTMTEAGAILVGHMWNAGGGLPQSQWSKSAMNPRFRNVVDKIISVLPISGNAPLAEKAAAQQTLTYTVDGTLRAAAPNGAAYINEADPFQPNWQTAFWGTNYQELLRLRRKWDPHGVFYAVSTPGTEDWTQIEGGTWLCKKI